MPLVVRNIPRAEAGVIDALAGYGVATVHEAQGRKGLLASYLRPIYRPAQIAGSAGTCSVAPRDKWTIHVAGEEWPGRDRLGGGPAHPLPGRHFCGPFAASPEGP